LEYDDGGALAAAGTVHPEILEHYLRHPYFKKHPPKSLDRLDFRLDAMQNLSAEDGAATLTAFTVEAVLRAAEHFPIAPLRWLVCGGGVHNATMMQIA
jgi:anhydro-N-acetylmuramic acid kinase